MTDHLTKYGSQTNYRVPPESTGARIAHFEHWYFYIEGLVSIVGAANSTFELGTSGIHGVVHGISTYAGGHRLLVTAHEDSDLDGFIMGENCTLTSPSGVVQVTILREWNAVYLTETALVDAESPNHHLKIDGLGAASVRFTEGEPQFDAYGLIRMVEPQRLMDHTFRYSASNDQWQLKTTGTAALLHLPEQSSVALDIGTAATDSASYTTNRYHRYSPGVAHLLTMSVQLGDTGKAGCIRRWGYYNEQNGMFFELNGLDLNVVIRSDATGSIVEARIPQSLWSHDRVDGEGGELNQSLLNIDVSKQNVYWIDYQWHGAGITRFGTFLPSGKRIILHTVEHSNMASTPYMGTGTLPIRISCKNSALSASPSRIKLTSCSLFKEGPPTPDALNNNAVSRSYNRAAGTVGDSFVCVGAFRAAALINGQENRKAVCPRLLNYFCSSPSAYQIIIRGGTVLDGTETWAPATIVPTAAEVSTNPTVLFEGLEAGSIYFNAGANTQEVSDSFNSLSNNLTTMADGTPGIIYTLWVKLLTPAATGNFSFSLNWLEI